MFGEEFIAKQQQERQAARERVAEHTAVMQRALEHGQHEALGIWDLGSGVKVSVEIMGDGTLRARQWTKHGEQWVGVPLAQDDAAMDALRGEPEPVEW